MDESSSSNITIPQVESPALVVRALREDEIKIALALGNQFFADRGLPGTFSLPRACETWSRLASLYPSALIAALDGDHIVGGIGVAVMSEMFSDYRYAAEAFFFVLPTHRRLKCGERLLAAAERWAAEHGVGEFRVAGYHAHDWGPLARWYHRRGYTPFTTSFRKEGLHVSL